MRAIFAGLFAFAGLMVIVALVGDFMNRASPVLLILISLGIGIAFLLLIILALLLFNGVEKRDRTPVLPEGEWIKDLETQDLLNSIDFCATRALQITGPGDEEPHFFIALETGKVLFLTGQYLDDYNTPLDDPEAASHPEGEVPIYFPCTEFTIRRHKIEGFAIDILCRGHTLETEYVEPAAHDSDGIVQIFDDGSLLTDMSFEDLLDILGS